MRTDEQGVLFPELPTASDRLRSSWARCTEHERQQFLEEVRRMYLSRRSGSRSVSQSPEDIQGSKTEGVDQVSSAPRTKEGVSDALRFC